MDEADEEGLAKEQEELDAHDDTVEEAMIRITIDHTELMLCQFVHASVSHSPAISIKQGIRFSP